MPAIIGIALAFGAGLWTGLVLALPQMLVWLLFGISALNSLKRLWGGILALAVALGIATGCAVSNREARHCSSVWRPGPKSVLLRIGDRPGDAGRTRGKVISAPEGCDGTLRLRVDSSAQVPGGTRVVAVGVYRGRGVFNVSHLRVLTGGRSLRYAVRDAVARRVHDLYGARAGLVEAVVLGRRDGIDRALRENFTRAGLAHLLAISGLHVGVLAGWCVILARALGARRRGWLWGTAVVWVYVASLGFPAPATRAAGYMSIIGISRARQRHPPPGAVLALALLIVLAVDPAAATSVGAWLSATAVWGTRTGVEALGRFRLLGASLGATLATAPITAFAFGAVAPIGILANLAAVPLASLAVPGLFLSLAAGGIVAGGTGVVFALIERIASIGASVPGGNLVGTPGIAFAIPWFGILCLATWLHKTRPDWAMLRRRAIGAAALASWSAAALSVTSRSDSSDDLLFYLISVGQGDAIAIRTPRGSWALIDGGPRTPSFDAGRRIVLPFFRRLGVARLAAVVVTHGDSDHLGGIPAVVEELEPEFVLDPGQPIGTDLYLDYLRALDVAGATWRPARAGDSFVIDSVLFEVLHPSSEWMSEQLQPNENSVVMRVTHRCFRAILAGDIGHPVEKLLAPTVGVADFLKVAHHGSGGSTDQLWLDSVRPRMAAISVGRNSFGHPAPEVLRRLTEAEIPVFRTDQGGTVTIRSDGRYLESVQGEANSFLESLLWTIQPWLRSRGSFSKDKRNTRRLRVTLPACSST